MYADAHLLYTAYGSMAGGEEWSCGLRTLGIGSTPIDYFALQGVAAGVRSAWSDFFATTASMIGSNTVLQGVDARYIGTDGKTVTMAESVEPANRPGSATVTCPNQCAVVVTLLTQLAGKRRTGRIFVPTTGASVVGATGALSPTAVQSMVGAVSTLLNLINATSQNAFAGARLAVQSRTGSGGQAQITGFKIGSVVDTQRRRRNSIAETYISATLVP